jgi:anti-sigma B factor antagonist
VIPEQAQPLSILVSPDGEGNVVVALHGEIDVATADQLREALVEALTVWSGQVVIDLAGVSFIDSQGLGILIRVRKDCDSDPKRLTIRSPQPQTRKIFELTGLDTILGIED